MKFFNPKEETLKIELTPYGKEQFSKKSFDIRAKAPMPVVLYK